VKLADGFDTFFKKVEPSCHYIKIFTLIRSGFIIEAKTGGLISSTTSIIKEYFILVTAFD